MGGEGKKDMIQRKRRGAKMEKSDSLMRGKEEQERGGGVLWSPPALKT